MSARLQAALPLALIVIVGAALRLYLIGSAPPGFYRDEAYYALDAAGVLRGEFALWFPANNGREGLFIYLLAGSIAVLGQSVFAVRITAALVGVATLIAMYCAGRAMFSARIGVLAAAVLAITFWHVALSRVAYRAITLPLLLCITLALLFHALRTNDLRSRLRRAALAGASAGLTIYTYTSAQFLLPLLALYLISLVIGLRRAIFRQRGDAAWVRHRASVGAFVGAFAATLAPFALTVLNNPGILTNRAAQVSILSPAINGGDLIGTLLRNIGKAIGMFWISGDRIWRHNLSFHPVFDGFLGAAFALGLIVCVWRWWRSWQTRYGSAVLGVEHNIAPQFALMWLAVFLIPTVLAEDTPHYLRAIGALPAACLIAAVGLEAALIWASRRGLATALTIAPLRRVFSPPAFLATLILIISGVNTFVAYFNDYVRRDQTGFWLESHNVALAERVRRAQRDGDPVLVDARLADDNPALRFLAPGTATFRDGAPPASADTATLIVDPNHDWRYALASLNAPAQIDAELGAFAQNDNDAQARRAFAVIRYTAPPADASPAWAFERGIALLDAATAPVAYAPDNVRRVTLRWRATESIGEDLAVFVHWTRAGEVVPVAQHDGDPGEALLPTSRWRVGDVIVDGHTLAIPDGVQPGDELHIGLYRRADQRRLNARERSSARAGDYAIFPAR